MNHPLDPNIESDSQTLYERVGEPVLDLTVEVVLEAAGHLLSFTLELLLTILGSLLDGL